jgi:hypothetical protein
MPPIVRSVLAIVAGIVVVVALSAGTDWLVGKLGSSFDVPDPTKMFALATLYRCAYAVAGGYVAARLAPSAPVTHAVVLGVIGTVLATAGVIAMWSLGNHWYPIALAVTALPCSWLGGRLAFNPPSTR